MDKPAKPMMRCGHAANATRREDGAPCCVICVGINPGALEIDTNTPDLTNRIAYCSYGKHGAKPSSTNLAFFSHQPDSEFDSYYCGCYGWD